MSYLLREDSRDHPPRGGSHRGAHATRTWQSKTSACNTTSMAFPCSTASILTRALLCTHARPSSLGRKQEREKKKKNRSKRSGKSRVCKINVPVTPHCSTDRSVSGIPPADVALGGRVSNPLTRRGWSATDRAKDASAAGSYYTGVQSALLSAPLRSHWLRAAQQPRHFTVRAGGRMCSHQHPHLLPAFPQRALMMRASGRRILAKYL